jgi:hypothetical protein
VAHVVKRVDTAANSRDPIDAAIDDVARQLTRGAPRAGFTARVLARIERPPARWQILRLLAPLAAAAVLVIAFMAYHWRSVNRDSMSTVPERVVRSTEPPHGRSQRATQPQGEVASRPGEPAAPDGAPPAQRRRGGERVPRSLTRATEPFSEVNALAPPALQIGPIELDRIAAPDAISIDRLETFSIALAPIGEGEHP